jgi:dephospho-CoA kinase
VTRTLRIGVTGPIGCGKSTIGGWLAARGATVIDADRVSHDVTEPGGPALAAVLARFGDRVRGADGALDRAELAAIVFSDAGALADLQEIVTPVVRARIRDASADADARNAPAVVVEAIRLVEGGLSDECDEVWLVTCDAAEQRERLAARGMSMTDADRRIAAQSGILDRVRPVATRIIDANGPRDVVERRVDDAWRAAIDLHRD